MRKILVPVDGAQAERTAKALAEAARLYASEAVDVHLLNVQPVVSGHVAMFFGSAELLRLQQQAGAEDLAPAQALLASQQVPCSATVRVGRSAETIARAARELGCDRILLGQDSAVRLGSRIFGSLSQQLQPLLGGGSDCQVIVT